MRPKFYQLDLHVTSNQTRMSRSGIDKHMSVEPFTGFLQDFLNDHFQKCYMRSISLRILNK